MSRIRGLCSATVLLIALEFGFVYWLNRIDIPGTANGAEAGFIVMPPWYQKPRFEVTMLLMILAGLVFWACRGMWDLRRHPGCRSAIELARRRVTMAGVFAVLTGLDLALVTFLRT